MRLVTRRRLKRLESLVAGASGAGTSGGFDPTPYLQQDAWFVNYGPLGNNANDGKTALTPVARASEIRRRWNGGLQGVTPTLPAIDIAIQIAGSAPDLTDPLCVLWDLYGEPDCSVVIDLVTTVKRAGTIAAVPNAFARTATGQQTVTDLGVADWTSDVDSPLLDTASDALSWVVAGGSPATLAASRAASTTAPTYAEGVANHGLAAAAVAATNAYEILTLPTVYFGTGGTFRLAAGGPNTTGVASVLVRRGHGRAAFAGEVFYPNASASFGAGQISGALIDFAECAFDQIRNTDGGVIFSNCRASASAASDTVSGVLGNISAFLAGYARRSVILGVQASVDQDFQILGSNTLSCGQSFGAHLGVGSVGNFGRFLDGAAALVMGFLFNKINIVPDYDGEAVVYGTTAGQAIFNLANEPSLGGGEITAAASAASTFVTDGGAAGYFVMGGSAQTTAYGFDTAAGTFVGPTNLTVLHLDAALMAGAGFGKVALWPPTGSRIAVGP